MTEVIIDAKRARARKGEYLLAVARREGIDIPTLCDHPAVEPAGACRLCMVEITKPQWDGWSKVVTACLFPVEEGLVVRTDSPRVRKVRKEVLELLLARSPDAEAVRKLAAEYGVEESKYPVSEVSDNCILCDICTRVCQDLVTGAISRLNRGVDKEVNTPFAEVSDVCVGCLACARSCPTDAIPVTQEGRYRTIWGRTFELEPCAECGAPTVSRQYAEWVAKRTGVTVEDQLVCPACKVVKTAAVHRRISW